MRLFFAVSWSDAFYDIRKKFLCQYLQNDDIFLYRYKYFNKKKYIKTISLNNGFLKHFLYVNCVFDTF